MNNWQWVFLLTGSFIMFWFSFSFLIAGKTLYGNDATTLWVSGILFYMAANGVANFIRTLIDKYQERNKRWYE